MSKRPNGGWPVPGKLIMCQGLPASGKSTWASQQNLPVVTRDDIRRELFSVDGVFSWKTYQFSKENEEAVTRAQHARIAAALGAGLTVISADTNISRQAREGLHKLANEFGATVEVRQFKTPPDECIRRDALRGDLSVGADVINRMAKQWGIFEDYTSLTKVELRPGLPYCLICDLDGTLAWHDGRSPYDETKIDTDWVNASVRAVLWHEVDNVELFYMTGRHESARQATVNWLAKNWCPAGSGLFMRADGDSRKDWIVKAELFDKHLLGRYNVLAILDDRTQVVKMWRARGLQCWQVAEGDF